MNIRPVLAIALTLSLTAAVWADPSNPNDPNDPNAGDPAPNLHPMVAKLMIAAKRDAAFARIIQWQKYRGEPAYRHAEVKPLKYVVVVPQERGGNDRPFRVLPAARQAQTDALYEFATRRPR